MPTLFPDQTIVKLKTVILAGVSTDITSGGFAFTLYPNSIADPMGTLSISAQPTGLDQLATYYNRYYVAAAKVKYKLYPSTTTGDLEMWQIVSFPSMEALIDSDYRPVGSIQSTEQPYAVTKEQYYLGGRNGAAVISQFMTSHKISGGQFDKKNPDCCGELTQNPLTAQNPIAFWYFNGRAEVVGTEQALPVKFRVEMYQYTCFFNRTQIPDSAQ